MTFRKRILSAVMCLCLLYTAVPLRAKAAAAGSTQAEERVFGEIRENKDAYLEENSLQRGLKQYLLAGKKVGIGRGIIINKR